MQTGFRFRFTFPAVVIALLLGAALFSACRKLEYSPYQTENDDRPENVTVKNIEALKAAEPNADDTVVILYLGDTHRFYDELTKQVNEANKRSDIDFAVVAGDLSDFGILEEFMRVNDILKGLKVPVFCAVGNHDLIGTGNDIYYQMFGEKNFSFTYKGYKFFFHDTNGREYDFNGSVPNLWWIQDQLRDSAVNWFVGVSHVPPFNEDFDKSLEMPYKNLLKSDPRMILSMHGHQHFQLDENYYKDHVRYMICNSTDKQRASIVRLSGGQVSREYLSY